MRSLLGLGQSRWREPYPLPLLLKSSQSFQMLRCVFLEDPTLPAFLALLTHRDWNKFETWLHHLVTGPSVSSTGMPG